MSSRAATNGSTVCGALDHTPAGRLGNTNRTGSGQTNGEQMALLPSRSEAVRCVTESQCSPDIEPAQGFVHKWVYSNNYAIMPEEITGAAVRGMLVGGRAVEVQD